MKKTTAALTCTLIVMLITWYSCQKNPDNPNPGPPIDPTAEKVTASLRGRVTDENSKPVGNATVKSGTATTTTDINGIFKFDNIQLSKNAGFVTVEKTGYLKGSRTIFTNANTVNNVEIQLIPKVTRGSFAATGVGAANMGGGSIVEIPANGVINTATNTAYTGTVTVSGAWLDPTNPKLHLIMPGNLTGLNTQSMQMRLITFGMMAVELEGAGGEKLNLATGKTATIKMPIPASLQGSAPSSIPLWYFDETKGIWVEEGSATRQGNEYVGTVSHFSFWNCDVPANFVNLKLTLKNQSAQPLANYKVKLTSAGNGSTYGFTDSAGVVNGAVPVNSSLALEVYNTCGTSVHTQNVGPFTANADVPVTITTTGPITVTLTGTLLNCSNAPVTNGFAEINMDGIIYRASTNSSGVYTITINKCHSGTSNAKFTGTDIQANQVGGDTVTLTVTTGTYNVPNVRACGTSLQVYVIYNANGNNINFAPPLDSFSTGRNGANTYAYIYRQNTQGPDYQATNFDFAGPEAAGTYALTNLQIMRGSNIYYVQNGPLNTVVTEYGAPGGYVAGTFSGTLKDSIAGGSATVPFSGSFRIRRY